MCFPLLLWQVMSVFSLVDQLVGLSVSWLVCWLVSDFIVESCKCLNCTKWSFPALFFYILPIVMSCRRTQRDFYPFMRLSVHSSPSSWLLRPKIRPFKPRIRSLRLEIRPPKSQIRPLRPQISHQISICSFRPEICPLRPWISPIRLQIRPL